MLTRSSKAKPAARTASLAEVQDCLISDLVSENPDSNAPTSRVIPPPGEQLSQDARGRTVLPPGRPRGADDGHEILTFNEALECSSRLLASARRRARGGLDFAARHALGALGIWLYWRAGQALRTVPKHPGGRPPRNRSHGRTGLTPETDSDRRISKASGARLRQIGAASEALIEGHLRACWESRLVPSLRGLLREIRGRARRRRRPATGLDAAGDGTDVVPDLARAVAVGRSYETIVVLAPAAWGRGDLEARAEDSLERLPVPVLASEDAHVHLLVRPSQLDSGLDLLRAWGFRYRASLVARMPGEAQGVFWRAAHLTVLTGTRGDARALDPPPRSWLDSGDHIDSDVVGAVLEAVQSVSAPPRLLVNADRLRDGWACWGPEMDALYSAVELGGAS